MQKKNQREKTVVHTFSVQPSQLDHIRQAAFDRDISMSKYICNALRYYEFTAEKASDFTVEITPNLTIELIPKTPAKN